MLAVWPQPEQSAESLAVWAETLAPLDFAIAYDATHRLKESNQWFPSHAEFLQAYTELDHARARKRAAIRAAQERPQPGTTACIACGDSQVEWHEPIEPGCQPSTLPCRVCRHEDHLDQLHGHHRPDHDVENCDWPRCVKRRGDSTRRQAMSHATRPPVATHGLTLMDGDL